MAFERTRQAKSFGEPVRVRTDGSRTSTTTKDDDAPRGPRSSTAYEKYKEQLHAFFSGQKPLPDHLKELLQTRPGASEHMDGVPEEAPAPAPEKKPAAKAAPERSTRRVVATGGDDVGSLVDAIRKATSPREVEGAIDALKSKGHDLPLDPEVLSKALGHSKEDVHAEALRGIKSSLESGTLKATTLLKTRIHNVALLASSGEVRDLCAELKRIVG
jgi:hypothetical protein